MRRWSNNIGRYGAIAIGLHWLMAVLLVALVGLGLYMVRLPDAGYNIVKIALILYHKELGILALVLATLRLGWRVAQQLPMLVGTMPVWEQVAARLAHLCLYTLMLALPLTGWVMSSAAGFPVSFLGLGNLPDLVGVDAALYRELAATHRWLAYALIALVAGHAGAALRHHFVLDDDTLLKMLRA